jgi:hypothetical protein
LSVTPDIPEYCREVETYLCQKNGGHLIRIVGPAFEQVCGWASQGVPLNVVFRGIDQYCERYMAKGPRRRPVRIEFCEADILDLFDDWRRAIGVSAAQPEAGLEPARKLGLASHIERAIARLTTLRAGGRRTPAFLEAVDLAVRDLDILKADAQHARGDRRNAVIARLEDVDRRLTEAAGAEVPADDAAKLREEAGAELAPFASRMAPDALASATNAAFIRLLRESLGIPTLRFP